MLFKRTSFQPATVMQLVQVVCNVQTITVSVLVMLGTKGQHVILLVVVTLLVQAALYVISQQVNVPAILEIQEPHVIPVTLTTIKRAMELAQVSLSNIRNIRNKHIYLQPVDVTPLVQAVYNVLIQLVSVLAILDTQVPHATLVTLTTTKQVMEHVQVCNIFHANKMLNLFKTIHL